MSMNVVVSKDTGEVLGSLNEPRDDRGNKDFVMMQRDFLENVADLGMRDPIALRILLFIVKQMDHTNALAITMKDIAEILGIARQTVSKRMSLLVEEGWICALKFGREHIYTVNPDVAWTSYANQKKYCRFQTNVILAGMHGWDVKPAHVDKTKHIDLDLLRRIADQQGV